MDLLLGQAEVPIDAQSPAFQVVAVEPVVGIFGVPPFFKLNKGVALALAGPPVDPHGDVPQPAAPFHVLGEVPFPKVIGQVANEQRR